MEALHRALSVAREEPDRSKAERDKEACDAIERVREIADHLRASDQRISELQTGLQATSERAQRVAEELEQAKARSAADMARADAAERRAEEAEDRLNEMMIVIQEELAPGRSRRG